MQRLVVFSLVWLLSGLMSVACQRDQGVRAGNESETYQPRPAPQTDTAGKEMKGELVKVNAAAKSITVRLENGTVQTFKVDDSTAIEGLGKPGKPAGTGLQSLTGKEGSEVTVWWDERKGAKVAERVEVTTTGKKQQK
jgi:hypothetical protein